MKVIINILFIILLTSVTCIASPSILPSSMKIDNDIFSKDPIINKYIIDTIKRVDQWTSLLERLSPPYVWGGVGEKGGDCSGQMYYIFHKSGLPYLRTTSLQMWRGAWPGETKTSWKEANFPNLLYFTFTSNRPSGHVGIVRANHHPYYLIYGEASSSRKIFKRTALESDSKKNKSFVGIQILDLTVGFKK